MVLKSSRFLYREIESDSDAYAVAARLSFALWDSIPDQELLSAATAGRLSTKEQVAHEAQRMVSDLRARSKLHEFLLKWLKADTSIDLAKDAAKFPGFDAAVIGDLRTSLELFLDDVLWSERSDFRQLLLADDVFLNDRLTKFYAADSPPVQDTARESESDFTRVKTAVEARAGVLTHPF